MRNVVGPLSGLSEKSLGLRCGSVQEFRQAAENQLIKVAFARHHAIQFGGKRLAIPHPDTRGISINHVGGSGSEMQFDKLPCIKTIFVHVGQWPFSRSGYGRSVESRFASRRANLLMAGDRSAGSKSKLRT